MMIELFDKNLIAFDTSVIEVVSLIEKLGYIAHILIGGKLEAFCSEMHTNKIYNIFFLEHQYD